MSLCPSLAAACRAVLWWREMTKIHFMHKHPINEDRMSSLIYSLAMILILAFFCNEVFNSIHREKCSHEWKKITYQTNFSDLCAILHGLKALPVLQNNCLQSVTQLVVAQIKLTSCMSIISGFLSTRNFTMSLCPSLAAACRAVLWWREMTKIHFMHKHPINEDRMSSLIYSLAMILILAFFCNEVFNSIHREKCSHEWKKITYQTNFSDLCAILHGLKALPVLQNNCLQSVTQLVVAQIKLTAFCFQLSQSILYPFNLNKILLCFPLLQLCIITESSGFLSVSDYSLSAMSTCM